MERFSYQSGRGHRYYRLRYVDDSIYGVVDVDVRISSHLKEELTWAIDKRLRVISTIMLF